MDELRFRFGKIYLAATVTHRLLGAALGLKGRRFVQITGTQRRIRQHSDKMSLHLKQTARNKEKLLFAGFLLNADFSGLQTRQKRRVLRGDPDLTHLGRRKHHSAFTRPDFFFGANDLDFNGIGHCRISAN